MGEVPYWPDDPLIKPAEHRLQLDPAGEHLPGGYGVYYTGSCSCGGWSSPRAWDDSAQMEAFDGHMADVQATGTPAGLSGG